MKIGVFGASGKMGSQLASVASSLNIIPYLGFYHKNIPAGYDRCTTEFDEQKVREVECLIDFSLPISYRSHLSCAVKSKKPLVSGVTGIKSDEMGEMIKASAVIPVLWSPNFSLGIALFKSFLVQCGKLNQHFDYQLEEVHHAKKKDSPSGTALYLQGALKSCLPAHVMLPEPISVRGGGVVGEHTLRLFGQYESIKIEHSASDRKVFALGALKVSQWLISQSPGFYTMDDFFKDLL